MEAGSGSGSASPPPPSRPRPLPSDNAKAASGTGWSAAAAGPGRRSLPAGRSHAWGGTQGARSPNSLLPLRGVGWGVGAEARGLLAPPPPTSRGPDLIIAPHGTLSLGPLRSRLIPT